MQSKAAPAQRQPVETDSTCRRQFARKVKPTAPAQLSGQRITLESSSYPFVGPALSQIRVSESSIWIMLKKRSASARCSLFALPEELFALILRHCDLASSAALRLVSHKAQAHVEAYCWYDEEWLVEGVPLRLLLACSWGSNELCLRRLEAHADDALHVTPPASVLHSAIQQRPHATALLLALLQAHPDAVLQRCDEYEMLPIEVAAEQACAPTFLLALLDAHIERGDRDAVGRATEPRADAGAAGGAAPSGLAPGRLSALHLALINGASDRLVRSLLRASPASASRWACENEHHDEYTDLLPIHFAAVYGSHKGDKAARAVEAVHAAYARGVATREGRHGMLPLHLAALSAASLHTIRALAAAFPDALHATDDLGRRPLECAAACAAAAKAACGPAAPARARPALAGYSRHEYVGLNARTARHLARRDELEHVDAVVATMEELTRGQPRPASVPRTWRYCYGVCEGDVCEVTWGGAAERATKGEAGALSPLSLAPGDP